jgi:hypothetical protein
MRRRRRRRRRRRTERPYSKKPKYFLEDFPL